MIKPLYDRVVVKVADATLEEKTSSGFILPTGADKLSRHKEGEVIAVGSGRFEVSVTDERLVSMSLPMSVNVGDTVIFSFGEEYTIQGQKVYILKESDILAIIE